MVIVDTTVWVDYFNDTATRHTDWLEAEVERQRLGLTDLILCEILQGVRDEAQASIVQLELLKFEIHATGGVDLALAAAKNYRTLRAKRRTVRKTIDSLIATFCLMNDHALLHNDRDYDAFEEILDLRVVHP